MTNKKYLVEYETNMKHGIEFGYFETRTQLLSEKMALARFVEQFPRAKVYNVEPMKIEEQIELVREGQRESLLQEQARKLAIINDKMKKLEEEKRAIEAEMEA